MSKQRTTEKIQNYFESGYPVRGSLAGKLFFRHGENKRIRIVREWVSSTQGICIVDVGCGDGKFLASVICGRPRKIMLEDISAKALLQACQNLKNKADIVEKYAGNSLITESGKFDLVLAVGVLDYYPDWKNIIKRLLKRSQGCIIISLPRIDNPRNWLRCVWFSLMGIRLQMTGRKQLIKAMTVLNLPYEIKRSFFEWCVCIFAEKGKK